MQEKVAGTRMTRTGGDGGAGAHMARSTAIRLDMWLRARCWKVVHLFFVAAGFFEHVCLLMFELAS